MISLDKRANVEPWERKAADRDRKIAARRAARMVVSNRSIKDVILGIIIRKGREANGSTGPKE